MTPGPRVPVVPAVPPPSAAPAGPRAGWPGPRPMLGSAALLDELHRELHVARQGTGRVVFVHGAAGSGRAELVRLFEKQARRDHRKLRTAIGDAADPDTPAWRQIALRFTAVQRVGVALRRSTANIVDLVPVVGGVLAAMVDTFNALRPKQRQLDEPEVLGTGSTVDQVRLLFVHGRDDARLIVLENLDASDPDELAGAFALVQRLPRSRTLFVCTSVSQAGRMPAMVSDLLREAERLGVGRAIEIPPLSPTDVLAALREATGAAVPDAWRAWIERATPTTSGQLWDLLGKVIADGGLSLNGRSWVWNEAGPPVDDAIIPISDAELEGLAPDDVALLTQAGILATRPAGASAGAIEAPALAMALATGELQLEDRLVRLTRRRLLELRETVDRDGELVDIYAFGPGQDPRRWAALRRTGSAEPSV
jgi:hypothetical protein